MSESKHVWVFLETEDGQLRSVGLELLGQGRLLADKDAPIELPTDLSIARNELAVIRSQSLADERAAHAAEQRKNELVAYLAHDIRTPLNAVVGYASLISAHGGEAERVRAYSDKVLAASEQLLDVVNETLEISRMEAGHVQLAEAECSLSELVLQARMDMVDLADRADVTLACDIEPLAHDRVLVDAVRLSHVLTQLVDNAIKYSAPGGRITVKLWAGEYKAFAEIIDQGRGIPPEDLENVKTKFYKGSNSVRGSGIGLALVDSIMTALDGTMDLKSTLGRGTVVTLGLPIYKR